MLNGRHANLLQARGLDLELLERLGVDSYGKRGPDWIAIPYFENGNLVNHKYRTVSGEKEFYQDEGSVSCFWNCDILVDDTLAQHPLIITEGEFDAITALQCGFPRVVSVPNGAPPTPTEGDGGKRYSYLERAVLLKGIEPIIIASDTDEPGANLLHDLSLRLGRRRCKWVKYPEGCKDLNDVLQRYGYAAVVEALNGARWCHIEGVYRLSELPPRNPSPAYKTGIPVFEDHYKLRLGDFAVLTGIPGHGKSTLLNEIMGRMTLAHGWNVAVASFEQRPETDHRRALRRWRNRKPEAYQTAAELAEADAWIEKHFAFIVPRPDDEASLSWILERAAVSVTRFGANMIVIDPWNEMDHDRPRDMSLTEYTGHAIKEMRRFAQEYNVHFIVAAHPTKLMRKNDGSLPCPTLYDISDSAHWANKPDVGIVIYRNKSETMIRVSKARYPDETGDQGDVKARFNRETGRFDIIEPDMGDV